MYDYSYGNNVSHRQSANITSLVMCRAQFHLNLFLDGIFPANVFTQTGEIKLIECRGYSFKSALIHVYLLVSLRWDVAKMRLCNKPCITYYYGMQVTQSELSITITYPTLGCTIF